MDCGLDRENSRFSASLGEFLKSNLFGAGFACCIFRSVTHTANFLGN